MKLSLTLLLLSLGLTTGAQDNSENYRTDLLLKWDNATTYALEIAEAMPADQYDYKPTDEVRTFEDQVVHTANNIVWLSSSYLDGGEFEKESPSGKEACIDYLSRALAFAKSAQENLDLSTLDTEIEFFAGPMRKRRILFLLNDHLTHHRGQMVIYLRMQGIKPARYKGW